MDTIERESRLIVHDAAGGRKIPLGDGGVVTMKIEGAHSNQALAVYEFTVPPRTAGPPQHIHTTWDEAFYVLAGEMTFLLQGRERVVGAGGFVFVPHGEPHTFWNAGDIPATNLTIFSPAGIERYFDAVTGALAAGASDGEVHALFAQHEMTVVDDGRPAYGLLAREE